MCQIKCYRSVLPHLCKALLTVILKMFRVDIDVILVDSVRLGKLGRVLQKLLYLHRRRMQTAFLKRPQRNI